MKLRTLEKIERDEKSHGPYARFPVMDVRTEDLRPGPIKSLLLGIGELLIAIPRLIWRLLDFGLGIAIILGIVGCIVFGLVYLFG